MKHFKKMMALIIALVMVVGTMTIGTAFGAGDDGLTTDGTISITGLTQGDNVKIFKVLKWVDGTGWRLTEDFAGLDTPGVNDLIANKPNTELSAADLAAIATKAQGKDALNGDGAGETISGTTYTYTAGTVEKAGMYVAFVTAAKAGTVYNPIVISADFSDENATNTIPASSAINGTSVAKKKEVTLDKTEPKITNDDGDTYEYTVTTTIPVYSAAFQDQYFTVQDSLSDYLDFNEDSFQVNGKTLAAFVSEAVPSVTSGQYTWTPGEHGFTLKFNHAFVSKLEAATPIEITYTATLNVPKNKLTNVKEEENDITVTFPNNPNDLTGKQVTALKDGTREYTFTLDGKLFGNSDWQTAELVKVGLDKNNSPIEAVINVSNGSSHAALKDATFGLFLDAADADAYIATGNDGSEITSKEAGDAAGMYTNDVFFGVVKTSALGLMEIQGLDAGTYVLRELDAPSGYIKDGKNHTIEITADINGDAEGETGKKITEWYTVDETTGEVTWHDSEVANSIKYEYYVPVLNSYTIKIDGQKSSTYTMTLSGPSVSSVTPAESSTDIVNTKGVELPSTGGIGTTIFYVIGAILVLGAGVLLVTRRRMSEE